MTEKFQTYFIASSADWWAKFREWEQLCCPRTATVRIVLLFLFFLLLELIVFVITLIYIPSRIETGSFLLDNGVPSILIIASIGSIVMLAHMLSRRKCIGVVATTLQRFDQTLQRLDFRLRCEEVIYWTVGWIITFVVTTILFSISIQVFGSMVFGSNMNVAALVVFINVANVPYTICSIWAMIFALCVWYRLKLLNTLTDNSMRALATTGRKERTKRSHTVAGLTDLQSELATVVEHINAVFGLQMTLSLSAFTMLLIFCIFSYYRAAVVMGDTERYFAWLIICWSLYNCCTQLPKVLFGSWIGIAAKRQTRLVYHYLRQSDDILSILSQQLEHLPLTIRSWFSTINWPVYATIIGYISTYVVILIQFDSKAMDVSKANLPNVQQE
uniref:Gustatory receptor n=1 Tax=Anopheles dirus TaxID=7168 RepID=A0A182NR01_9DIPT